MICKKNNAEVFRFLFLVFIIAALFLGVMIDSMIICKKIPVTIKIENISEFSLALIQIQATIVTLMLSIIGILSGVLSDQYMGVSVSYYFLEIKPRPITQKIIIYVEFILLGLSLIGYVFLLYNFIFFIFISSLILVVTSIVEMYEVFKGKKYVEEKIQNYVTNIFEKADNNDELANEYIEYWGVIVVSQSKKEFQTYSDVFFKLILTLLEHQKIEQLNSYTEKVALCLLRHDYQDCKLKGLLFVNDVYKRIREWIQKVKNNNVRINQSIDLLDKVNYDWYCALCSIDAEIVKQTFIESFGEYAYNKSGVEGNDELENNIQDYYCHWFDFFTRNAFYVNMFATHKTYLVQESIIFLAKKLGKYIVDQSNKQYYFDLTYWQKLITDILNNDMQKCFYKMQIQVPEEKQKSYYDYIVERDIYICIGYIMDGQIELVTKGWLPGKDKKRKLGFLAQNLRKGMSIHFFMYYIIRKGKKDHINQTVLEQVKHFITEKKFIIELIEWYKDYTLVSNNKILLNIQLARELESLPKKFKQFISPIYNQKDESSKYYFIYVVLKIDMSEDFSDKNILRELKKNHREWSKIDTADLKEEFSYLHQFLCEKELSEEEAKKETDKMIAHYENITI